MRGFQPAKAKAAKPFANGGPVRGPGTGTSDEVQDEVPEGTYIMPADSTQAVGAGQLASMGARGFVPGSEKVPVQLSNGEYKLPPEQVHAIGVQTLDQMKDATHQPVARGFNPGAAQEDQEPRMFFANGGVVDEDAQRKAALGGGTAVASLPQEQGDAFLSTPNARAGLSQGQQPAAPAATAPAAPSVPSAKPPAPQLNPQAQSDRARIGAAWDTVKDVNDDAGRAIADVAMMVPRGLVGAYDTAVVRPMRAAGFDAAYLSPKLVPNGVDPSSMTPYTDQKRMQQTAAPAQPPSTPQAAKAPANQPATPVAAPAAAPVAAPAQTATQDYSAVSEYAQGPAAAPAGQQVMPGVYRNGNAYGDSPEAVSSIQARGLPSARNMAAGDALADRSQQESMARVQAQMAEQQPQAGFSGVIGTSPSGLWSRTPEQQRRDAEVQATSIHKQTAANGRAALQGMDAQDLANIRAQGELNQDGMRQALGLQREAMQQSGENSRTAMREIGNARRDGARNAIDQGRLNLDQQVRGFDIRSGERQEALRARYDAAKTDEERAAIAKQIRDLSGKQAESPWKIQVTPAAKNADGSTTEGSIYRYNTQTGAVERADTGGRSSPYPEGQVLQGKDGKTYVVKNGQPVPK